MANGQLPEETRDMLVEQLMQELFSSVLPTQESGALYTTPTLFIGCGGTGKGIVREVRKRVRALYPDNPLYQFVVFDTDPRYAEGFGNSEFYYIGNFDPALVVHPIAPDTVVPWWQRGFIPEGGIIDDGARTIRALGRLAVFHNIHLVCNAISTAIRNALNFFEARFRIPGAQAPVHAYIVSSVSGGTGSGMYLDIAYLTQELCTGLGVQSSHLVGVLGLPNIFENTLNLSAAEREAIEANSYAALEELDQFMSGAGFRCNYGPIRVNSVNPPFNMVYLFGASNRVGLMLNKRETIFAMVGAALQLEAASTISQSHAASYAFVAGRWGQVRVDRAFYSSLAAASITFPADLVVQFCGLQLAHEIVDTLQSQRSPESSAREAQDFANSNNLNEDGPGSNQVQDYLNQDERGQRLAIIVSAEDLAQRVPSDQNAGASMRRAIQDFENLFRDYEEVIRSRAEILLRSAQTALTERVASIATNPSRGPAHAIQFVSDVLHLLRAYSEQMQQEAQQQELDLQQQIPPAIARYTAGGTISREESWARMVEQAAGQGRLFRGRRVTNALRNVASDMNRYYATRLHIVLLQQSKVVFDRLTAEAERLQRNLQALMVSMENLKGQLLKQLKAQEYQIRTLPQQESTALSVVDLAAVQRLYQIMKPANIHAPLASLLSVIDPSKSISVEEMANSLLQASIQPFLELKQRGMVQIMRLVYPDNWQTQLSNMVAYLFSRVLHPFWSYRPEYPGVTKHRTEYYFAALPAGDDFLSKLLSERPEQPQQIPTNNPHTMLVLYLEHNLPLSPLALLPQLYESYENILHRWLADKKMVDSGKQSRAQYPPLHLHRDWHRFPDVLPPDEMAGRLKTFALAVAYGFIRFSQGGDVFLNIDRRKVTLGARRTDAARRFVSESELVALTDQAIRAYENRLLSQPSRLLNQLRNAIDALSSRIAQLNILRRASTAGEQGELTQLEQERSLLQQYLAEFEQDVHNLQAAAQQTNRRRASRRSAPRTSKRGEDKQ